YTLIQLPPREPWVGILYLFIAEDFALAIGRPETTAYRKASIKWSLPLITLPLSSREYIRSSVRVFVQVLKILSWPVSISSNTVNNPLPTDRLSAGIQLRMPALAYISTRLPPSSCVALSPAPS